jgi:hypothetical protein
MHVAGDLTLRGGILEIELDSGLSDTITVDGKVTLGGTLHLKYLDGVVPESGRWEIIKSTEGIVGNFARFPFGLKTRVIGNSVFVLAVPEPSSMLLLGMACLIGAARFRAR